MAIGTLNTSVHSVNDEFGSLVLADLATSFNGFCFCVEVATGSLRSAFLHVPTAVGVVNDMM